MITYGASGPILDQHKFKNYLKDSPLEIDECHTAYDQAVKVTLVHFKNKKVRQTELEKFMDHAKTTHGIISTNIYGYPSIKGNEHCTAFSDQAGFRMLIRQKTGNNPAFTSWIETPGLRGGDLLEKHLKKPRPTPQTKPRGKKRPAQDIAGEGGAEGASGGGSILAAMELICEDESNYVRLGLIEMEERFARGDTMPLTGGVYFAWSDCLNCMKISHSRTDNPILRTLELSRHITTPFAVVRWIPTPTPSLLASIVREHFAAHRVSTAGAGAEFFKINPAMVSDYVE